MTEAIWERTTVLRRGRRLEYVTVAWNLLEGLVAVVAGRNSWQHGARH
jgi:hypothetical protein